MNVEITPLTEASTRILRQAEEEAIRMGHSFVNTSAILMALCRDPEAITTSLRRLGLDGAQVRREIDMESGIGDVRREPREKIFWLPHKERVLEKSSHIAREELKRSEVDPDALLLYVLSMADEGSKIIGRVLGKFGFTYEKVLHMIQEPVQADLREENLPVVGEEIVAVIKGYRLAVKTLRIPTDPWTYVFAVSLSGEMGEWRETYTSEGEVNAFIRGLSAAAMLYKDMIPLPVLTLRH